MTRRKKAQPVKPEKKLVQTAEDILKKAGQVGWKRTLLKTAIRAEEDGTMMRLNCRGRISTTLEKKVVHSAKEKADLRNAGNPVRTSHWEVVRKVKHKEVVLTNDDIKL